MKTCVVNYTMTISGKTTEVESERAGGGERRERTGDGRKDEGRRGNGGETRRGKQLDASFATFTREDPHMSDSNSIHFSMDLSVQQCAKTNTSMYMTSGRESFEKRFTTNK